MQMQANQDGNISSKKEVKVRGLSHRNHEYFNK